MSFINFFLFSIFFIKLYSLLSKTWISSLHCPKIQQKQILHLYNFHVFFLIEDSVNPPFVPIFSTQEFSKILFSKFPAYRIVFVYRNEDDFLNVKPDLKIIDVIKKISKKIAIPVDNIYIKYNDKLIKEEDYNLTVKKYFDFPRNKSRPILYVKFKSIDNNINNYSSQALTNTNNNLINSNDAINKSNFYGKDIYRNKVKITNYPSMMDLNVSANDDIYNIINTFLKEIKINSDFYVERKEVKRKQKKKKNLRISMKMTLY